MATSKQKRRARPGLNRPPVTDRENGRRRNGRFAPGNRCAAGRRTVTGEARDAFRSAVTARDLARIAKRLTRAAIAGDVGAAGLILDRLIGKPRREADDARLALDLPALTSLQACSDALTRIIAATSTGTITVGEAQAAAALVESARESLAAVQIEARVNELEAAVAMTAASMQ